MILTSHLHKLLIVAACIIRCNTILSQELPIIPKPNTIESRDGNFEFSNTTHFIFRDPGSIHYAENFITIFADYFSIHFITAPEVQPGVNYIISEPADWGVEENEKYELLIEKEKISIKALPQSPGFYYALNTLLQIAGASTKTGSGPETKVKVHCLKITDKPRYAWRGMHLDVSRHFFDISFVKKYIDLMAFYKLNTFHWHLTDDQGWRIEIKKYPNLIVTGAWRAGSMEGKPSEKKYDAVRHGGYYTQDEIRQVVQYAAARHITIVPEIEMPGHSVAAIASYPWLSCTGKKIEVEKGWGVFDDVYCTRDTVFTFIEDVLAEVMDLFPGRYIHIGGDECPKVRWEKCKHCRARMKNEKLKNGEELQSYFIRRVEKFVNSRGRQIIGWDEILEGGLAPNAAVMSWRGTKGGIAAAREKHNVVMSPGKPCYFDHYQSTNTGTEPLAIGGYNPLDSVYAYNPTPDELNGQEQKYILGAQANLWTEYITNDYKAFYMFLPRMLALSEVLWTQPVNKNLTEFKQRLNKNVMWLDYKKVNYARHSLNTK